MSPLKQRKALLCCESGEATEGFAVREEAKNDAGMRSLLRACLSRSFRIAGLPFQRHFDCNCFFKPSRLERARGFVPLGFGHCWLLERNCVPEVPALSI